MSHEADDIHAIKMKVRNEAFRLLSFRALRMRMSQLDDIIMRKADKALFTMETGSTVLGTVGNEGSERKRSEKIVFELLKKVKKRKKMIRSYTYLSWFSLFFFCFLGSLYLKEDNLHLYAVDFSIRNRVVDILPSQGTIPTNALFYDWFAGVAGDVFPPSVCGNGICEPPEEYPGFGRFGCVSDCGRFLQKTPIRIDVMPAWKSKPGGLDLPGFVMGSGDYPNANFSFNIYSDTMKDYLFEADVTASGGVVDVPDGNLWLELYQTEPLFHDTAARDIADYAQITRTGGLRPNKSFDYQYGDPAEAIATVAQINRQMHQYCTIDNDGSPPFASCPLNYDPLQFGSILRNRYGLAGKVSVSLGATKKTIVSFPFCTLSPAPEGSESDPARIDPRFCTDDVLNNKSVDQQNMCFDGAALSRTFSCKRRYPFSIWAFGAERRNVSVRPASESARPKTLTPFNNIVGGIILSQYRRKDADCSAKNQDAIRVLTGRYICQAADRGDGPFGIDPVFQKSSSLYNGKLSISDFYADNERAKATETNTSSYPFAFFPHQWQIGGFKQSDYISRSNIGVHKLFFDTRISPKQSQNLVQFMKDGMFISDRTEMIEMEIITYNADFDIFGILTVQFTWDLGGGIFWSAQYNTAQLSPYTGLKGQMTLVLEIIFGIMLFVDVARESRDIYLAFLQEELIAGYIAKTWNWIDWSHYGLLGTSLALWTVYNQYILSLNLKSAYPILKNLEAKARYFATDAKGEYEFLELTGRLRTLAEMKNVYTAVNCLSILFFIVRLLKILDFQPRMSLITRTLRVASTDLFHYTCLFAIIITGYASVGTLLFGDRLEKFQTFSASCRELFMISIGWDPVYQIMGRAAKQTNVLSTSLVFLIFYWSWVLVATVLMLNMLLAIIIEAYASVRMTMNNAPTIVHESWIVCRESAQVAKTRFCAGDCFVSDDELEAVLLNQKRNFQSSISILEAIGKLKCTTKSVRLAGGFEVSEKDIANLLKGSATGRSLLAKSLLAGVRIKTADQSYQTSFKTEDGVEISEDTEWNPPAAVANLIERYGEIVFAGKDDAEFLKLIQAENMKRQMAMHTSQDGLLREIETATEILNALVIHLLPAEEHERIRTAALVKQNKNGSVSLDVSDVLSRDAAINGKLKVTLVAAKHLPKLDVFTESDPYCVLLLEEQTCQEGEVSLDPIARTEAKTNDANPIWNADFIFPLQCSSNTKISVAVLDKDENGADDLLGSVTINISKLPLDKEVDKWYKLHNNSAPYLTKRAILRIKILFCAEEVDSPEAMQPCTPCQKNSITEIQLKNELHWLNERLISVPADTVEMVQNQRSRILEVVLVSARHLPRRDVFFMKIDPYVKISFNGIEYTSVVRRRTYSPDWNQAFAYNFNGTTEVVNGLTLALMDWDRFSHDDLIGFAYISKDSMRDILSQDTDWTKTQTLSIKRDKQPVIGKDGLPSEVTLQFRVKNPSESVKIISDGSGNVSWSDMLPK